MEKKKIITAEDVLKDHNKFYCGLKTELMNIHNYIKNNKLKYKKSQLKPQVVAVKSKKKLKTINVEVVNLPAKAGKKEKVCPEKKKTKKRTTELSNKADIVNTINKAKKELDKIRNPTKKKITTQTIKNLKDSLYKTSPEVLGKSNASLYKSEMKKIGEDYLKLSKPKKDLEESKLKNNDNIPVKKIKKKRDSGSNSDSDSDSIKENDDDVLIPKKKLTDEQKISGKVIEDIYREYEKTSKIEGNEIMKYFMAFFMRHFPDFRYTNKFLRMKYDFIDIVNKNKSFVKGVEFLNSQLK